MNLKTMSKDIGRLLAAFTKEAAKAAKRGDFLAEEKLKAAAQAYSHCLEMTKTYAQ